MNPSVLGPPLANVQVELLKEKRRAEQPPRLLPHRSSAIRVRTTNTGDWRRKEIFLNAHHFENILKCG